MKINLLFILAFLSLIIYANVNYDDGIVGHTKRDGNPGCLCHSLTPTDSVIVWIEGPDSVDVGDSVNYKLLMTGGPAIAGGFDLASYFGVLDSTDTLTHIMFGELTHSFPNLFLNDTVKWNFLYVAPDSSVTDTLYSVGNSVNLDGIPSDLDQWNFGENFIINVIDNPVDVKNDNSSPDEFVLYQNYPNPFNPATILSFAISHQSFVTLKVFDILGDEVATLVNEFKPAGKYEIEFNLLSGIRNLVSGIYFYQLKAGSSVQTKKMVLLK